MSEPGKRRDREERRRDEGDEDVEGRSPEPGGEKPDAFDKEVHPADETPKPGDRGQGDREAG